MSDSTPTTEMTELDPQARVNTAMKMWRDYRRMRADKTPTIRVGIAASFTADTFAPFVGSALLEADISPEFAIGPYNQLFQVCLDPVSAFAGACDAVLLLWRLEDLMQGEIAAYLSGDAAALGRASDMVASLVGAIAGLRNRYSGMLVVTVPPFPASAGRGPLWLDNPTGLGAFHRVMVGRFIDEISRIEGVYLADFDALQRNVGLAASYASRHWYLYKQPFSDVFLYEAGRLLGRIIAASRRAAKKCIVLDCDNTLWGGIIGEDGIDGIEIGDEFPGSAYRDFQRLLLDWRRQGIFLAIASKNNEADVWEVFDKHSGMVLKREHLSAWQVNWLPKAENISLIARALNIGTDSLVFIDDNPMEIAYMQSARPEVTSILLPEEAADIVPMLQGLAFFDQLEVTDEDRKRADMMRAERDREALGAQIDHGDFLNALDLKIDLFQAEPHDLGRITQLINKTNQFNLTTIRRTLDEVRELAKSPDWRVYGLRVIDRFGEYGLTGVILSQISPDRQRWTLDTVLMSCRVLGRGVEAGIIGGLADDARAAGAAEFFGSYIPTKKNALCASFLPDHGFVEIAERQWRLALSEAPAVPAHITRISAAEAVSQAA
jgi:FkbH-like protein